MYGNLTAVLGGVFDSSTVDPTSPFDPLPNNRYLAIPESAELKPTKNGAGKYVQVQWQVIDGQFKGRKFWTRFNIQNPSVEAQKIGQAQLSATCRALGIGQLADTSQLVCGKPVFVTLKIKDGQNEPTKFEAPNAAGSAPALPFAQPAAAPVAAAPSAPVAPPWAQKK